MSLNTTSTPRTEWTSVSLLVSRLADLVLDHVHHHVVEAIVLGPSEEQLGPALALHLLPGQAQDATQGRVGQGDGSLAVDDQHPVAHGVDDVAEHLQGGLGGQEDAVAAGVSVEAEAESHHGLRVAG
jgi:hypothetical protein